MNIRVMHYGIDTLEATFDGTLCEELSYWLDYAKSRAQASDTPQLLVLAGEKLYVTGKGMGHYAWVLTNHRMHVRISRAKKGIPVVSIRLLAGALAIHGHKALYADACSVVAELGDIMPNTLSRIDLCADVQGISFTDADAANLVCAASYRGIHKDGEGVTYQIGKGDAVMRIYRKDVELRAKKNLSYAKLWENGADYDPDEPVWRIEIQLRGSILNDLGARNVLTAFTKLGALFRFGMQWCELRVPSRDSTKKRWPADGRWTLLAAAWGEGAPEPRIRRAAHMEREDRVVSRLVGAAASLGAYSGQSDLVEVMIYAMARMEAQLKEKGVKFDFLQRVKVARLASEEEVGF